jgi:hypothetical protein
MLINKNVLQLIHVLAFILKILIVLVFIFSWAGLINSGLSFWKCMGSLFLIELITPVRIK